MKEKLTLKNIFFTLLLILILGGVSYGGWREYQRNKESTNQESKKTEEQQGKPVSTIEDLGDGWKKYTNHEYGISFEVPEFWEQEDIDKKIKLPYTYNQNQSRFYLNNDLQKQCEDTFISEECSVYVSLRIFDKFVTNKPLFKWYEELDKEETYGGPSTIVSYQEKSIADVNSWVLKLTPNAGDIYEYYEFYVFVTANKKKGYILEVNLSKDLISENIIINRLINTIKFE